MVHAYEMLLGVGEKSTEESWLGIIIRKELVEINMLLPDLQSSDCLLTNMGEYLCRATDITAQLADRLANGNHIHTYAQLNVNQTAKETNLSELGFLDIMAAKHSALKILAEKLECASKEITLAWRECTAASQPTSSGSITDPERSTAGIVPSQVASGSHSVPVATELPTTALSIPPSLHDALPPTTAETIDSNNASSAQLAEPTDSTIKELLQGMNRRGKGLHYCPYGSACAKGGVSASGSLILFERNSAFKAHLEKHLKQFKCNLPGCPNTTGFSRPDLLYRHQAAVPHNT